MNDILMNSEGEDGVLREFDTALAKILLGLESQLGSTDVLNPAQLRSAVAVFEQQLIVLQHEFLGHLARLRGHVDHQPTATRICVPGLSREGEVWAGVLGGGASMMAANTFAVATTTVGHLWWAKTVGVTLASLLAGPLGLPVALATAAIGAGGGYASAKAVTHLCADGRRDRIRREIIMTFKRDVEPKLRKWARDCVES